MTVLRAVLVGLIALGGTASAQELSKADCQEILTQYGVVPAGCRANGAAIAPASVVAPTNPMTARLQESHVFFVQGGTGLTPAAMSKLQKLARVLDTQPMSSACLKLVGHSDSVGAESANQALSQVRAQVVSDYLSKYMTDPARIEAVIGTGEQDPLAGFASEAAENRRVAIHARQCPPRVSTALR